MLSRIDMTTTQPTNDNAESNAPEYPQHMLIQKETYKPGIRRVSVDRFFKQEFHDLEVERIWKKAWQWACREEDIPEVGDHTVYEVADLSFIIMRTGPESFAGYWNSCPHRGRKLATYDGKRASEIRCMFHGWAWNIDGSVKELTCGWDFKGARPEEVKLQQVKVETWGGYVFINPDLAAEPLADFLGELPDHFEGAGHDLAKRWKQVHVTAYIEANWKIVQEAFLEGWHLGTTHPQLLAPPMDPKLFSNGSRWDDFGNFMRMAPGGAPHAPGLPGYAAAATTEQQFVDHTFDYHMNEEPKIKVGSNGSGVAAMQDSIREAQRQAMGDAIDDYHVMDMSPGVMISVWPNFHPWGGFSRIMYRFRPYKSDPNKSVMDVLLLAPWEEGKPRPPATTPRIIDFGESIVDAKELGILARIFVQDLGNMVAVHEGLKSSKSGYVILSDHHETQVRRWHDQYDHWMGLEEDSAIGTGGVA
jgi:nitrite reductase/ring-hydroxylating ferredoxin subunit